MAPISWFSGLQAAFRSFFWQWQGGKTTYARHVRSKEFATRENARVFVLDQDKP